MTPLTQRNSVDPLYVNRIAPEADISAFVDDQDGGSFLFVGGCGGTGKSQSLAHLRSKWLFPGETRYHPIFIRLGDREKTNEPVSELDTSNGVRWSEIIRKMTNKLKDSIGPDIFSAYDAFVDHGDNDKDNQVIRRARKPWQYQIALWVSILICGCAGIFITWFLSTYFAQNDPKVSFLGVALALVPHVLESRAEWFSDFLLYCANLQEKADLKRYKDVFGLVPSDFRDPSRVTDARHDRPSLNEDFSLLIDLFKFDLESSMRTHGDWDKHRIILVVDVDSLGGNTYSDETIRNFVFGLERLVTPYIGRRQLQEDSRVGSVQTDPGGMALKHISSVLKVIVVSKFRNLMWIQDGIPRSWREERSPTFQYAIQHPVNVPIMDESEGYALIEQCAKAWLEDHKQETTLHKDCLAARLTEPSDKELGIVRESLYAGRRAGGSRLAYDIRRRCAFLLDDCGEKTVPALIEDAYTLETGDTAKAHEEKTLQSAINRLLVRRTHDSRNRLFQGFAQADELQITASFIAAFECCKLELIKDLPWYSARAAKIEDFLETLDNQDLVAREDSGHIRLTEHARAVMTRGNQHLTDATMLLREFATSLSWKAPISGPVEQASFSEDDVELIAHFMASILPAPGNTILSTLSTASISDEMLARALLTVSDWTRASEDARDEIPMPLRRAIRKAATLCAVCLGYHEQRKAILDRELLVSSMIETLMTYASIETRNEFPHEIGHYIDLICALRPEDWGDDTKETHKSSWSKVEVLIAVLNGRLPSLPAKNTQAKSLVTHEGAPDLKGLTDLKAIEAIAEYKYGGEERPVLLELWSTYIQERTAQSFTNSDDAVSFLLSARKIANRISLGLIKSSISDEVSIEAAIPVIQTISESYIETITKFADTLGDKERWSRSQRRLIAWIVFRTLVYFYRDVYAELKRVFKSSDLENTDVLRTHRPRIEECVKVLQGLSDNPTDQGVEDVGEKINELVQQIPKYRNSQVPTYVTSGVLKIAALQSTANPNSAQDSIPEFRIVQGYLGLISEFRRNETVGNAGVVVREVTEELFSFVETIDDKVAVGADSASVNQLIRILFSIMAFTDGVSDNKSFMEVSASLRCRYAIRLAHHLRTQVNQLPGTHHRSRFFSSELLTFSKAKWDEPGDLMQGLLAYLATLNPKRDELRSSTMLVCRIERASLDGIEFGIPGLEELTPILPENLLPVQFHNALMNARNSMGDSDDDIEEQAEADEEAAIRVERNLNSLVGRYLLADVRSVDQKKGNVHVTARGIEYLARAMYLFFPTEDSIEEFVPNRQKTSGSNSSTREIMQWDGHVWAGASNSWLVVEMLKEDMTAVLANAGTISKELVPTLGLRRFTVFSAASNDSEHPSDAEEDDRIVQFTDAAFRDLFVVFGPEGDVKFFPGRSKSAKRPSDSVDHRKNRTFLAMFHRVFGRHARIEGWSEDDEAA